MLNNIKSPIKKRQKINEEISIINEKNCTIDETNVIISETYCEGTSSGSGGSSQ